MLKPPGRPGPRRGSSRGTRGPGNRGWVDAEAGDDDIPPARWAPRDEGEATRAYPAFIDGSDDGSGFDETTSDALDHAVDDDAERRAYVDDEGFAYEGEPDEADDQDEAADEDDDEVEADVADVDENDEEDEGGEDEGDEGDADEGNADEGDVDADDEWVDAEAEAIDADAGALDEAIVEDVDGYEPDVPVDRPARGTGAAGYADDDGGSAEPSASRTPRASFDAAGFDNGKFDDDRPDDDGYGDDSYDDSYDGDDDARDLRPRPAMRPPTPARGRLGGGPPTGPPPRRPPQAPRAVVLKQRRRRRRFIVGLTFFLSASVSMVGSSYVYLQYRLGQIPRVDVPSLVGDRQGEVMNVLLVGSDSRDRLEGEDALQAGKGAVSGQRSDTIMVLHIDPAQEQAAILSIPRDLYVPIAGEAYADRVNAAFALGGAQGLIETIQQSLGITINHYVEVDFVGFKDIVDAVGGVQLYLPAWVRDFTSGLDIHEIGCVEVDGTQGLAWVRSRNFQYLLDDGLTWADDPRGDLGRIERQQDFIRRMLKKALSSGITNPLQLNRLIGIGVRDVTLDETLSTKDITTLARRFNNLDANSVALLTLPTTPDDVDGASVLRLQDEAARPYLDRINGMDGTTGPITGPAGTPAAPTTTVPDESLLYPEDVEVRVLNGEGTPGAAGEAAAALEGAGFDVAGTGDATEIPFTTIRHSEEALGEAQLLQRSLAGGAKLVVDDTVTSTDVVLVIGFDYEGLTVGPVGPGPRPSTTIATSGAGASGPTTTTVGEPTSTTAPPTTLGPTTLPPGVEC
ncbi:MAG: hypothetical protein QOG82_1681 [Actinomycetota bacterium]|nr:hypothetical protein [Actinomycetota bacterium]